MHKKIYLLSAVLGLFGIGIALTELWLNRPLVAQTDTDTVVLQPILSSWSMADQPAVASANVSFVAHIVELTTKYTAVVYSLPSSQTQAVLAAIAPTLRDDSQHVYGFIKRVPLKQVGPLEFGVLYFEPRQANAHALRLTLGQSSLANLELARVIGPGNNPTAPLALNSSIYRENYAEQLGYQISFNGWALYKEDRVAKMLADKGETTTQVLRRATEEANAQTAIATPTPVPVDPTVAGLPKGQAVLTEATLRIANQSTRQVYYLYIQLLANGDATAALLQ